MVQCAVLHLIPARSGKADTGRQPSPGVTLTDTAPKTTDFPLFNDTDLSLSIDKQKRRAKELRDAARLGEKQATDRIRRVHPRVHALDFRCLKLADAQCVVAREAGLSSWPALKKHVEQMETAGAAIESGTQAPDVDVATLHIRCGSDIEAGLKRAGFAGAFLEYADPICQGPISDADDAIVQRARFISSEYPGEEEAQTVEVLSLAEHRLSEADTYGRIVLWFEHDPYDQLLLVKILTLLARSIASKRRVEIVSIDRFPGIAKFIGLGQTSPAALRHMFSQRHVVPEGAFVEATRCWQALISSDPTDLGKMAQESSRNLPFLANALNRYLSDLPDIETGLSFSESAALRILADGPLPWGRVFGKLMREADPLPFHGDLMFLGTLLRLRDAEHPALTSDTLDLSSEKWGKTSFALTDVGKDLLEGALDWKDCGPGTREHGGLTCFASPDWRWDPAIQNRWRSHTRTFLVIVASLVKLQHRVLPQFRTQIWWPILPEMLVSRPLYEA